MKDNRLEADFFELVVREVIRRLKDQGMCVQADVQDAADDDLRLPERLITRATLQGRLAGVRRIIVEPRAIVTPAVRDELRDQAIELVRRQ